MTTLDRRDPEYREQRAGRRHATSADFAEGLIGEDTYRASMAALGHTPDEVHSLVRIHRPFQTIGKVAAGFVSGLPARWRNG